MASFGHNIVGPLNRAVDPPDSAGPSSTSSWIWPAVPFAGEFVKSEEEWLRLILRPLLEKGVAWDDLWRGPVRIPDTPLVPWADRRFDTPSGRFQLLTEVTACADCRQGARYPYHFLTVGGAVHLCSERVPGDHGGPVVVSMATEEAVRFGLADGGPAWLVSPLGRLAVTVRHDAALRPDVVACERGGWIKAGQGVNLLIPESGERGGPGHAVLRGPGGCGGHVMIAREWKCRCPDRSPGRVSQASLRHGRGRYHAPGGLLRLPDPGARAGDGEVEVTLTTYWTSRAAMTAYAGTDATVAVLYPGTRPLPSCPR